MNPNNERNRDIEKCTTYRALQSVVWQKEMEKEEEEIN